MADLIALWALGAVALAIASWWWREETDMDHMPLWVRVTAVLLWPAVGVLAGFVWLEDFRDRAAWERYNRRAETHRKISVLHRSVEEQ